MYGRTGIAVEDLGDEGMQGVCSFEDVEEWPKTKASQAEDILARDTEGWKIP